MNGNWHAINQISDILKTQWKPILFPTKTTSHLLFTKQFQKIFTYNELQLSELFLKILPAWEYILQYSKKSNQLKSYNMIIILVHKLGQSKNHLLLQYLNTFQTHPKLTPLVYRIYKLIQLYKN